MKSIRHRTPWASLGLSLLLGCLGIAAAGPDALTITDYSLLSMQRLDRFHYQLKYRAHVENTGTDTAAGLTATLTSSNPATTVEAGALNFGDVAAGSGQDSTNTFTLTHDRRVRLRTSDWSWLFEVLPPPPDTVAPVIDPTVATDIHAATQFLYSGSGSIQTGVAPNAIEPVRSAVLRGRVTDKTGAPLAGVRVTVLGHAELGQTLSRADGGYDLAVNGGSSLTLDYRKDGYLPAQRPADVPWQDFVVLGDTVLLVRDPVASVVDVAAPAQMQVAQGGVVTDASGTRQSTVLIPAGTTAQIYDAEGNLQPVSRLTMHFTEYTLGPEGTVAMPAPMPPAVAYTYAVELGSDEAIYKFDGRDVVFSQPVYYYVENFLGFSVGIDVPVGYYDAARGAWVPAPDGRIIKILSETNGLADVDSDGDNVADNDLAMSDEERARLASLYDPGQSLQRIPLDHFSTYDLNYGARPVAGAQPPNQPVANGNGDVDDPCAGRGSIIECENRILGETVPVVGTPYTLNYRSNRVPGRGNNNTLVIPLTGAAPPAPLQSIQLEIRVAGQVSTQTFAPSANLSYPFTWDGRDAYGRTVTGIQPVTVRIGYVYPGYYNLPPWVMASFGINSGVPMLTNVPTRTPIVLWQQYTTGVGGWDARAQGLGGWSLNVHHAYDPVGKALYLGTGERRTRSSLERVIRTAAGEGVACNTNGGGDCSQFSGAATDALLKNPRNLATGPDGSLYILDDSNGNGVIRRVHPDGTISLFAGAKPGQGNNLDGVLATQADLYTARGMAIGPDGSLYLTLWIPEHPSIRRITPDGLIWTIAGMRPAAFSPDGTLAADASLESGLGALAVAEDGSIYYWEGRRIRRVGPDGRINTVVGNGEYCATFYPCDGADVPGLEATINEDLDSLVLDKQGNLYFVTGGAYIRKLGPDGILHTLAAIHQGWNSGYHFMTLGQDGFLYVTVENADLRPKVLRVATDGSSMQVVAGDNARGYSGDKGPATAAAFAQGYFGGLAFGPDGRLYVGDRDNQRVRAVSESPLPGFRASDLVIASEDGFEVYRFNADGRHLETRDALTGASLLSLAYDAAGRLISVTDADNRVTTIERNGDGSPTAIVSPYGQRTTLALDSNGYLASITNPAGESYTMSYTADGLLTRFQMPKGNASTYAYTDSGALERNTDAAGGGNTLARADTAAGFQASRTSAMDRTTTYLVERQADGSLSRLNTFPDGTDAQIVKRTDGTTQTTLADGTVRTVEETGDPRFGMQSPIAKSFSFATGGKALTQSLARSVALATAEDPFSLTGLTDTLTRNGRVSTLAYAADTRTYTHTTPKGRVLTYTTDTAGRLTHEELAGLAPIDIAYDGDGRLVRITQGTRVFTYSYDAAGELAGVTDPLGRHLSITNDQAGRTAQLTLPGNRQIDYVYDANGNLTAVTPPGRPAHGISYSVVDLPAQYTPPLVAGTGNEQYSYNLDQDLTRVTLADGTEMSLGYGAGGRLTQLGIAPGNETYALTYAANTGQLTSLTSPDGEDLSLSYSGALLTQVEWTGAVAGRVGLSYDDDLRVTGITLDGTDSIARSFDADGLLTQAGDLVLNRQAANGLLTGTVLGSLDDRYSYNAYGEVSRYTANYNGTPIMDIQYVRDELGRITEQTETSGGSTVVYGYSYDEAGRLVQVSQNGTPSATYTYDANDNRLRSPGLAADATYDDQDRLLTYGTASYAYTARGDLLSKTVGAETTHYDYDALGHLRGVTLPNGTAIHYLIDGVGRRLGKQVNGTLTQGFLWQDQLKPVAELDGSGAVISRFVYATDLNVPDYLVRTGQTYRLIKDQLGSVRLVVNVADGTVAQQLSYDEFGRVLSDTSPGFQPFGYAGGLYDPDTGLTRFGARDYDPQTGRWLTKDPQGLAGGLNLYAYAGQEPVNRIDPSGREPLAASDCGETHRTTRIATTTSVGGNVDVRYAGSKTWVPLRKDDRVGLLDKVRTAGDGDSVATLEFDVGGVVGLNSDTTILITGPRAVETVDVTWQHAIVLGAGAIWAKFQHHQKELQVQTSGGVLGGLKG